MKKSSSTILFFLLFNIGYGQQSYNITFDHDGKIVYGTFTTPDGFARFPTIIINPGSGPGDRDGTNPLIGGNNACLFPGIYGDTLKPYKELSNALVKAGYAVLRYDKLEYTYTSNLGVITFHKDWLPVESAIKYVKTRNDVDTSQIILIGHSEGSSLIPFIAKGRKDIKALISIAGPATPFDSIYAWQLPNLVKLLRPCGATATDSINAQNQSNQILNYFNTIRSNTWNGGTPAFAGAPASAWYDYIRAIDSTSINYNIDNLPTLFTGMGADFQVPPTELQRFKKEVTITKDFWSIPNLYHDMNSATNPHVSKILTDTIVYWLRQHKIVAGTANIQVGSNMIQIQPNPCNEYCKISFSKNEHQKSLISVKNIFGQTIMEISTNQDLTLDSSRFPEGIYFININTNGKVITKKIIKQ